MEYRTIDPDDIATAVIEDRHRQADELAKNLALDAARVEYCKVLRAIGDDPTADPALDAEAERLTAQQADADATVERLAGKLDAKLDPKTAEQAVAARELEAAQRRREWLDAYVAQVEREHAAHAALEALEAEQGNVDQAKAHAVAQLICEGARDAADAELASLVTVEAVDAPRSDLVDVVR